MRHFWPVTFLLSATLGGCGGEVSSEPEGERIDCAIGEGADFARECIFERISESEFVVHHPDGGFRRLNWISSEEGFALLDGAEEIRQEMSGDNAVITLDGARYSIPNSALGPVSGQNEGD